MNILNCERSGVILDGVIVILASSVFKEVDPIEFTLEPNVLQVVFSCIF